MKNLIGNEWKSALNKETIEVHNPYDNSLLDTIPNSSYDDVNLIVAEAYKAQKRWMGLSVYDRSEFILKFKDLVSNEKEELATLLTNESGKNINESRDEINNLVELCIAFVEKARHMYGVLIPPSNDDNDTIQMTSREPIGIIAAILPYNFPVASFAHKVPAALIMGNCVIVKPSSKVPLTITKLVYLLRLAGIPEGVIQVIHGQGDKAGHALAMHPDLHLITFSGSTVTGVKVMEAASRNLTRVLLELGSNDAMLVCRDADMDLVVRETINGRLTNSWYKCFASYC